MITGSGELYCIDNNGGISQSPLIIMRDMQCHSPTFLLNVIVIARIQVFLLSATTAPVSGSKNANNCSPWNIDSFLDSSSESSRSESPDSVPNNFSSASSREGHSETGSSSTLIRTMSMGSFQQTMAPSAGGPRGYRVPSGLRSVPNVAMVGKRQYEGDFSPSSKRRAARIEMAPFDEGTLYVLAIDDLCRTFVQEFK